jgi:hypothetical protein
MITKRDAEILEKIVRSMSERQSWGLVGWLSHGADGPFWDCIRRRSSTVRGHDDQEPYR